MKELTKLSRCVCVRKGMVRILKKHTFLIGLLLVFAAEVVTLTIFAAQSIDNTQDAVAINEIVQSVKTDWNMMETHVNRTTLDYVVLDMDGTVIFKTQEGLSESINTAIIHRDTVIDINIDGVTAGKMIVYNDSTPTMQTRKRTAVIILLAAILVQCGLCIGYFIYLNHTIIKPFHKLEGFAERIAGGNLDIPLEMDKYNLFGAFTESFDIMRAELKKAQIAEAEANASKKELVAKLSHDIKTPVASIKAASEVGAALTDDEKIKDNYTQIIHKADQINTLVTELFTATLEELQQLPVMPEDIASKELQTILESADYLHRAAVPDIPDCLIYADKLRLQQVFDNIFVNSYKYANTKIDIMICRDNNSLDVCIEDYGGGATAEELPLLKEKFKRGSNAKNMDGAGLGLYISEYFMKQMQGQLDIQNGLMGLRVTVKIPLSGLI